MGKTNKEALAERVALIVELGDKRSTKKQALAYTTAVFEAIAAELSEGNSVAISGHGTYEVRERSARKGRNPQTGAEIEIGASKTVGLRVTGLKASVK